MPNTWMTALKRWNGGREGQAWCIPKKGTPEYKEVRALMAPPPFLPPVETEKKEVKQEEKKTTTSKLTDKDIDNLFRDLRIIFETTVNTNSKYFITKLDKRYYHRLFDVLLRRMFWREPNWEEDTYENKNYKPRPNRKALNIYEKKGLDKVWEIMDNTAESLGVPIKKRIEEKNKFYEGLENNKYRGSADGTDLMPRKDGSVSKEQYKLMRQEVNRMVKIFKKNVENYINGKKVYIEEAAQYYPFKFRDPFLLHIKWHPEHRKKEKDKKVFTRKAVVKNIQEAIDEESQEGKGLKGGNLKLAVIAEEVYEPPGKRKSRNGWNYIGGDLRQGIWAKDGKAVVGIRGTDFKDTKDLADDAAIAVGALKLTPRYKQAKKWVKKAIKRFGKENVQVSGHSLGGKIAKELAKDFGVKGSTFNAGASVRDAGSSLLDRAACKINKKGKRCRKAKLVENYRTAIDPVSAAAAGELNTTTVARKPGKDPHTIANFTGSGLGDKLKQMSKKTQELKEFTKTISTADGRKVLKKIRQKKRKESKEQLARYRAALLKRQLRREEKELKRQERRLEREERLKNPSTIKEDDFVNKNIVKEEPVATHFLRREPPSQTPDTSYIVDEETKGSGKNISIYNKTHMKANGHHRVQLGGMEQDGEGLNKMLWKAGKWFLKKQLKQGKRKGRGAATGAKGTVLTGKPPIKGSGKPLTRHGTRAVAGKKKIVRP